MALSLSLWPSPLFGLLHVEAAAVVATAGFFIAGVSAIGAFRRGGDLPSVLLGHIALLAFPLLLLSATLLWRANCGYFVGLGLFLLFVVPSVIFAVAVGFALTGGSIRTPRLWFCAIGLLIATIPVAVDLLFHPQLYTYNHVFGGVLGPIYDEELAIRSGLFAFRGLTLLWAVWFIGLGRWLRCRNTASGQRTRLVRSGAALAVVIALIYAFAVPLGINTSAGQLERVLSEQRDLGQFVIHYQPGSFTEDELAWIEDEHRYRYARLREQLGVDVNDTIHTYLYPDPETRAALIGSRTTSVTPVWLGTPQIHMLAERFSAEHFGHELAHVFAREFGMPVIRASTAVGLVEGLAVAVEPPDGLPAPRYQVAATLGMANDELGRLDAGPADAIVQSMSPFGFWSGRGAVSYATSGAFAGFLLERFGADMLRRAYRTGDFEEAYAKPLTELAATWEDEIRGLEPDEEAQAIASWRFSQPSLFERYCPHHVPAEVHLTRLAIEATDAGEADEALRLYHEALTDNPEYAPALAGWTRLLIGGGLDTVLAEERLESAIANETEMVGEPDPLLVGSSADAYNSMGDTTRAQTMYAMALGLLPPFAREAKAQLILRSTLSIVGLRAVFSLGDAISRAELLQSLATNEPVLWFFAAGNLSFAGDAAGALNAFQQLPTAENMTALDDGQLEIVESNRLALLAHYADRAGEYAAAYQYAADASRAYREQHETGPAQLMDDLAAKAWWYLDRTE